MRIHKTVLGALTAAGLFLSSSFASAAATYMASAGRPWVSSGNIGSAWSQFNIFDAKVCALNSGSWVIPIPVPPTSSGAFTRTVKASFTPGTRGLAFTFTPAGDVYHSVVLTSNTNAGVVVPAGGTVFIKAEMTSATAPACIQTATFVQ
jgi:hypothetical protein